LHPCHRYAAPWKAFHIAVNFTSAQDHTVVEWSFARAGRKVMMEEGRKYCWPLHETEVAGHKMMQG
jgi:hypothetical protein